MHIGFLCQGKLEGDQMEYADIGVWDNTKYLFFTVHQCNQVFHFVIIYRYLHRALTSTVHIKTNIDNKVKDLVTLKDNKEQILSVKRM
jgi:hypothetical protein